MLFEQFPQRAVTVILFLAAVAQAADLLEVSVERDKARYKLQSETHFDATAEELYRVLIDYDLYTKFSSAFVEARNIEAGTNGNPRYFTRMQGCMLLFCKSFVRVGELILSPNTEIIATADPEESDFHYSREHWILVPDGDGTLLIYNFEMEPSFWVPPVIGPYIMKRVLRKGGTDAVDRIEALAQGKEPKR
jgi:hypothetical protein